MKSDKKCIFAVILAGGNGERAGHLQKQFFLVNKRPVLFYSLDIFLQCPTVSGIIIVVPDYKIDYTKKLIAKNYKGKNIEIIAGGKTRRFSSYNALKFIQEKKGGCDFVIFHDGVRPLLSTEMVQAVIEAAKKCGAAVLGSGALNVIAEVKNGKITQAFNAKKVYNTQTPHCYRFDWILRAHEGDVNRGRAREAFENIELVFALGKKIRIVDGFYRNMKLTFPQDIIVLEALLRHIKSEKFYRLSS